MNEFVRKVLYNARVLWLMEDELPVYQITCRSSEIPVKKIAAAVFRLRLGQLVECRDGCMCRPIFSVL